MSQDVKKSICEQLENRFPRLLPYSENVRVLIHQYEPLAHKFNRVSVKEVLQNIRTRYTQSEWYELKYLFRAIFVFILRALCPNSQLQTTAELLAKYPEFTNEKMSTLTFLLEFWNLLVITALIFDPKENAKDMMFFLERMCSPFSSHWNGTITQRVIIFEAETKVSLSVQDPIQMQEFRRPVLPHNNSTFHPAELQLQIQRQHQLLQQVKQREQQQQQFQHQYSQQYQRQYEPQYHHHQQQHNQFQHNRTTFPPPNPQLVSTVQQQRQQLELQRFQRQQQSLQQLYFPQPTNNTKNFNINYNSNNSNRKRNINDTVTHSDADQNRTEIVQPSTTEFWRQRVVSMSTGRDIPHRTSMLPKSHPVFSYPTHELTKTVSESNMQCASTTTLREVIKDVFREHYANKRKRFDVHK